MEPDPIIVDKEPLSTLDKDMTKIDDLPPDLNCGTKKQKLNSFNSLVAMVGMLGMTMPWESYPEQVETPAFDEMKAWRQKDKMAKAAAKRARKAAK